MDISSDLRAVGLDPDAFGAGDLVARSPLEELRAHRDSLAAIVTLEAGKIVPEARGEVQEMTDICDFACGLSRQLYGLTIASERPGHRMSETFPVAVWAWNFALAVVCGDAVVWPRGCRRS